MEGLLKELSKYGPTMIQYWDTYWRCFCEVSDYERSNNKQLARSTGVDLYKTLRELLKQSALTRKRLIEKNREPKQEVFEYGTLNKSGYKEPI